MSKSKNKVAVKVKAKGSAESAKLASKIGHTIGVKSGAGVSETWSALLAKNVTAKKTDAALLNLMKTEFPRRKDFQPVGRVRSFFNRGVQGYGNPTGTNLRSTKKESFAYDSDGNVTTNTDWGQDRKKNKKMADVARKRALKQWRTAAKKGKGKKSAKKTAAKKSAGKKPIKLKVKTAA